MTKYRVAIDIGGTFTDLVALNEKNGQISNIKVPSTPREPAKAIIKAFQQFLRKTNNTDVSVIVHATTIATNALLGQLNLELRENSGGPGKWRGGMGLERSWVLLASSATLSVLAERTKISPWGLYGGKSGAKGEYYIIKPNGKRIKLKSKCTVKIEKGDIFVVKTPGGGGYGNPMEREPKRVLHDVLNGLIPLEAAKKDYGVTIDPVTMKINQKSTQLVRAKQKT